MDSAVATVTIDQQDAWPDGHRMASPHCLVLPRFCQHHELGPPGVVCLIEGRSLVQFHGSKIVRCAVVELTPTVDKMQSCVSSDGNEFICLLAEGRCRIYRASGDTFVLYRTEQEVLDIGIHDFMDAGSQQVAMAKMDGSVVTTDLNPSGLAPSHDMAVAKPEVHSQIDKQLRLARGHLLEQQERRRQVDQVVRSVSLQLQPWLSQVEETAALAVLFPYSTADMSAGRKPSSTAIVSRCTCHRSTDRLIVTLELHNLPNLSRQALDLKVLPGPVHLSECVFSFSSRLGGPQPGGQVDLLIEFHPNFRLLARRQSGWTWALQYNDESGLLHQIRLPPLSSDRISSPDAIAVMKRTYEKHLLRVEAAFSQVEQFASVAVSQLGFVHVEREDVFLASLPADQCRLAFALRRQSNSTALVEVFGQSSSDIVTFIEDLYPKLTDDVSIVLEDERLAQAADLHAGSAYVAACSALEDELVCVETRLLQWLRLQDDQGQGLAQSGPPKQSVCTLRRMYERSRQQFQAKPEVLLVQLGHYEDLIREMQRLAMLADCSLLQLNSRFIVDK